MTSSSAESSDVIELPIKKSVSKIVQRSTGNQRSRHKTSDYSSEEDVFSEDKSNGQVKSALQVYKEAGEYWK